MLMTETTAIRVRNQTRRRMFQLAGGSAVAGVLASCGISLRNGASGPDRARPPEDAWSGLTKPGPNRMQAIVPATDLAVGPNRFTLGILHFPDGATEPQRLPDADLRLQFFFPIEPQAAKVGQTITPTYRWVDMKGKGLYVASVEFDRSGMWGVEVTGTVGGKSLDPARTRFPVKVKPDTPGIGSPAPRSKNLTARDVIDIKQIDSGVTPNDMHDLTIAEAIALGKPTVVIFATPGFCTTQTCAPMVNEMQALKKTLSGSASFVHVEIFKDPSSRTPFETVTEWGLTSEPWVFLIDKSGNIASKFEGPAPKDEVEAAIKRLI